MPASGVAAINIPVVTSADYVFDAAAPGGSLAPGQAERLDGWFQGLGLGYGDTVYVDGAYADAARGQVAAIAGQYGMLVSAGAPVTAGAVRPGTVRVVVSRRRADRPRLPRTGAGPSQPNFNNQSMSNFGCGGELQHRGDDRQPRGPAPRPRRQRRRRHRDRRQGDRALSGHSAVGHARAFRSVTKGSK